MNFPALKNKKTWMWAVLFFIVLGLISPVLIKLWAGNKIHSLEDAPEEYKLAIVFGAGIRSNNTPSDILTDRLDTAADLYLEDKITKILVSGDNSYEGYNEPEVMKNYLIQKREIPDEDIVADFAGRRSFDTCARANEIWGVESALLVSQAYHLPRTLYLCHDQGIKGEGISASRQAYIKNSYFKFREVFALYKALLDSIFTPHYIGGPPENDLSSLN